MQQHSASSITEPLQRFTEPQRLSQPTVTRVFDMINRCLRGKQLWRHARLICSDFPPPFIKSLSLLWITAPPCSLKRWRSNWNVLRRKTARYHGNGPSPWQRLQLRRQVWNPDILYPPLLSSKRVAVLMAPFASNLLYSTAVRNEVCFYFLDFSFGSRVSIGS